MSPRPSRRGAISDFLLGQVTTHSRDLVAHTAEHFGVSRQAIHRYVKELVAANELQSDGRTRAAYALPSAEARQVVETPSIEEDVLWQSMGAPLVRFLPQNIRQIAQHGFTEMVNNVRDHSQSPIAHIELIRTPAMLKIGVLDIGIGIFEKIRSYAGLETAAEAVFELSKGKFTTDPTRHSGEGIFFTSRIFDEFGIISRSLYFSHDQGESDWLLESKEKNIVGTSVHMSISPLSARKMEDVYNKYATSPEDADFSKTVIAVKLLETASDQLVSRSQAKRLLARLYKFKEVVLDFQGVDTIGQAFADEIFRVYKMHHPEVRFVPCRMSQPVERMVTRAQSASWRQMDSPGV